MKHHPTRGPEGGLLDPQVLDPRIRSVLVLGGSRSGMGAARVLAALGRQVVLSDTAPVLLPDDFPSELRPRVRVSAVTQDESLLEGADLVVKSPGVPAEAVPVLAARRRGVPVWGEVELASRLLPNPVTAVTGTNGKTTTTALIGHIMEEAGREVRVVGNIGTALTSVVPGLTGNEELVVEMSSFQLEDTVSFRPRVGVFLNLTPDHLDRHGDMDCYLRCKTMMFANQGPSDTAVLNAADPAVRVVGDSLSARTDGPAVAFFSAEGGPAEETSRTLHSWFSEGWLYLAGARTLAGAELPLRGRHNLENCLAAAVATLVRGVDPAAVAAGLRTFPGVPHRLEKAGIVAGVEYVNDSKATNVDAALKALNAYPKGVHLIAGGRDKGSDYAPLVRACAGSCVAVYLIGEAATLIAAAFARFSAEWPQIELPTVRHEGDMERAIVAAAQSAVAGETVLLAPACASFDQYENFEERGRHFVNLVGMLRERSGVSP